MTNKLYEKCVEMGEDEDEFTSWLQEDLRPDQVLDCKEALTDWAGNQERNLQTIAKKRNNFIQDPYDKPVAVIPGIGWSLARRLDQRGFDMTNKLLEKFVNMGEDGFTSWLQKNYGATPDQASTCTEALTAWDNFIKDPYDKPVMAVPGIGWSLASRLDQRGIDTTNKLLEKFVNMGEDGFNRWLQEGFGATPDQALTCTKALADCEEAQKLKDFLDDSYDQPVTIVPGVDSYLGEKMEQKGFNTTNKLLKTFAKVVETEYEHEDVFIRWLKEEFKATPDQASTCTKALTACMITEQEELYIFMGNPSDKSVMTIPGVGLALRTRIAKSGYTTAESFLEKMESLQDGVEEFGEWFKKEFEATPEQTLTCINALLGWFHNFVSWRDSQHDNLNELNEGD